MSSTNKPATWFWIASAIALLWNLMGVMAYIAQVTMSAETLQALPDNERALYESAPAWATAAFAIAVWGGALGSILLLIRKKWATALLIVSFIGIVVQMIHNFFIANSMEVYGPGGLIMPVMILVFGAGLIWFSRKATANGWLK
jgi:hypothetical protein